MKLNNGQQAVFEQLQEFIASDHTFFALQSGGGYGKTFLLNYLEECIPQLNKVREVLQLPLIGKMLYTATTNKAASLLGNNSSTIHKLFSIRPQTNYRTGTVSYHVAEGNELYEELLIIDEASMLDPDIFNIVKQKVRGKAKVIFALDPYQLAPIGYAEPIVNDLIRQLGIPHAELTEPMRQDKDSHLFQMCDLLRSAVRDQHYYPLVQGKGIRFVDAPTFQGEYLDAFKDNQDLRIITHENTQVEQHNNYIRKQLYGTDVFQVGDKVVVATAMPDNPDVKVESTYTIQYISPKQNDSYMDIYIVDIGMGTMLKIPANKNQYFLRLKKAQREAKQSGDWTTYYSLKNNYLDIRDTFTCTAHKSQGSTYDRVFLDFNNLALISSHDLNTFLRAFYVAVSRARHEVVVFGL